MTIYKIGEFAKLVHRTPKTIRRWEVLGRVTSKRLPSGHRYFDDDSLREVMGLPTEEKAVVVYCRVSSKGQKADLKRQLAAMQQWALARGLVVDEWMEEIGGGMNFKRPRFLSLVDRILKGEIKTLVVAHKDRLMRFGFDLLRHICEEKGCELIVVNQPDLSPEKEMVDDLLTIVHTFSCRLYGMRKYQKSLKEDFPEAHLTQKEVT